MLNVSQDYAQSLQRVWWRPSNAMGNQVLHGFHPLAAAATHAACLLLLRMLLHLRAPACFLLHSRGPPPSPLTFRAC